MLSPKKMIPRLAVAALPLAGTACGGDDGFPQDNATDAINAFCMKVAQCYPGYDSSECVNYEQAFADEARRYGDACMNLVASYFQCLSELSCQEYMDGGPELEACENELENGLVAACSQ